jgi:DNA ligase-1
MRRFTRLFQQLDRTTSTNAKVAAMRSYFEQAPAADGAWAVYLLSGRRMKRLVGASRLRAWLVESSGLPDWLVEEAYQHVGDLAETIALLTDDPTLESPEDTPLHRWIEERILHLRGLDDAEQRTAVQRWWRQLPREECFLFNKLLTGSLRVGVSQTLVERALAAASGVPRPVIAHRLMGNWSPTPAFFDGLFAVESDREDASRPYPFFLAHPLQGDPEQADIGPPFDWLVEWKWDGIRAQLVRRRGQAWLWSRGEDLISERFPEIVDAAAGLPDGTVLDGEILGWRDGAVLPFSELQRRIGRKQLGRRILAEVPVILLAYDLLEQDGTDLRNRPQAQRRALLENLLRGADPVLKLSPQVDARNWADLKALHATARERKVEGFMLKQRSAGYGAGRPRGPWWKWKVDPLSVDAVLIYAQPGHGRRANLYTDYTFAIWTEDTLVPLAKAYSGLDDAEIRELDRWIRRHTVERFGPVRSVTPEQVFELAFEGINPSRRHKSGVALRFPRIARWRRDLGIHDADTLETVRELLHVEQRRG